MLRTVPGHEVAISIKKALGSGPEASFWVLPPANVPARPPPDCREAANSMMHAAQTWPDRATATSAAAEKEPGARRYSPPQKFK